MARPPSNKDQTTHLPSSSKKDKQNKKSESKVFNIADDESAASKAHVTARHTHGMVVSAARTATPVPCYLLCCAVLCCATTVQHWTAEPGGPCTVIERRYEQRNAMRVTCMHGWTDLQIRSDQDQSVEACAVRS